MVIGYEQELFEYFELMMLNREDPYSIQDALNGIKQSIRSIQSLMPYQNVPDHLWLFLQESNQLMHQYLPEFNLILPDSKE